MKTYIVFMITISIILSGAIAYKSLNKTKNLSIQENHLESFDKSFSAFPWAKDVEKYLKIKGLIPDRCIVIDAVIKDKTFADRTYKNWLDLTFYNCNVIEQKLIFDIVRESIKHAAKDLENK